MTSSRVKAAALVAVATLAVILGLALAAGFFDRNPLSLTGKFGGERRRIAVLFFSGDMGVHFGAGPHVIRAFAASGIPVVGVSSPALFAARRTRAQVDHIVADGIETALATSKADRLIVIGQSFGSDILGTGLAALDPALRSRIAAVVLVVPGDKVFFRADPTDLTYRGTPDAYAADALARIDWVPITCVYGTAEKDSACPLLRGANVRRVPLPGGHFLNNDYPRLIGTIGSVVFAFSGATAGGPVDAEADGRRGVEPPPPDTSARRSISARTRPGPLGPAR